MGRDLGTVEPTYVSMIVTVSPEHHRLIWKQHEWRNWF